MANIKFTNFARSKLTVGISAGATTITITGASGALFPALTAGQYFYATIENAALAREIVKVTARTGDSLTVTRAQDNTTALAWNAGDTIALRFNAAAITDVIDSSDVPDGGVTTVKLADGAVTTVKLADGAVTAAKLDPAFDATLARLGVAQAFTKAQRGAPVALTDAASVATDLALGNNFTLTLAGNRTLANPTNLVAGQSGSIVITQDATGSRTLAYGGYWKFPSGFAPVLTTAANSVDVLVYYVESATRITAKLVGDVK